MWERNDTGDMCLCSLKWKARYTGEFYYELVQEWDMKGRTELTLGIGDFDGHVGKKMDGFEGVQENEIIE